MYYCFNKGVSSNSHLTSQTTKQTCEKDLGIAIDDAVWHEVWSQAMNISVFIACIQCLTELNPHGLEFLHIKLVIKYRMDANISPLCWKCSYETCNNVHCLWSCVKLQRYWSGIANVCYLGRLNMDGHYVPYFVSWMFKSLRVNTGDFSIYWLLLLERTLCSSIVYQECCPANKIMAQHYYGLHP